MFERFSQDARNLVGHAIERAQQLGHRYVGGEHMGGGGGGGGRVGLGAEAGLLGGLDRDALATIGIDLDAVRARIEASLGPRRSPTPPGEYRDRHGHPAPGRPGSCATGAAGAGPGGPWRRTRPFRAWRGCGRCRAPGPAPSGHIPFTPAAKRILELTVREALALNDSQIGVEHIALALTDVKNGLVPTVLSAAGTSAPALRAAILDQYRQAS